MLIQASAEKWHQLVSNECKVDPKLKGVALVWFEQLGVQLNELDFYYVFRSE